MTNFRSVVFRAIDTLFQVTRASGVVITTPERIAEQLVIQTRPRLFEDNVLILVAFNMGILCEKELEASVDSMLQSVYRDKA